MPYFIAEVEKSDLEQGKGEEAFGTETTEMPECHQEKYGEVC